MPDPRNQEAHGPPFDRRQILGRLRAIEAGGTTRYERILEARERAYREALEGWEARDAGNGLSVIQRGSGASCEQIVGLIPYERAVEIETWLALAANPSEEERFPGLAEAFRDAEEKP